MIKYFSHKVIEEATVPLKGKMQGETYFIFVCKLECLECGI